MARQFLADIPVPEGRRASRGASALTISFALHLTGVFILGVIIGHSPDALSSPPTPSVRAPLAWMATGGQGGSIGGGGEDKAEPARIAQRAGRDRLTLPAAPAAASVPDPANQTPPVPTTPQLVVPDQPISSGLTDVIGAVSELRPIGLDSRGPGSGLGADGGRGDGIGDRTGDRSGSRPGGLGGDEDGMLGGNGVSWPRLLQEVKPNYTAEAMRAQLEGQVELEIVVLADGSVGRVRLIRSLDPRFGLDDEAIRAVRRWRFAPGRHSGKAVAVRVGVELSFNLR